jgi:hypothetical protein
MSEPHTVMTLRDLVNELSSRMDRDPTAADLPVRAVVNETPILGGFEVIDVASSHQAGGVVEWVLIHLRPIRERR